MTAFRRTILTTTAALLLAALLAGCTPASGDVAGLIPGAAPAPASATPTPTAIPGDRDGNGTLSAFETEQLAKNALRDYTMPDGSVVTIDPTQPLPTEVVAVIKSGASPLMSALKTTEKDGVLLSLMNNADAVADATGKEVVFVYNTASATADWGYEMLWATLASHKDSTGIAAVASRDTVVADAQTWAGTRGYEVIVLE